MMWFRVDKSATPVPTAGTYKNWKNELREEGRYQCVYCAIGEPLFGGERNFHVEHYRPKKRFSELTNVFSNLFYCCAICNSFKGSDWPNEPAPDFSNCSYPNPSAVDYTDLLSVDGTGIVSSDAAAGKYVIERLNLNRAQLRMLRRFVSLRNEVTNLIEEIGRATKVCEDIEALREAFACAEDAYSMLEEFTRAIPYEPKDARR
jgi:uncharacterized protein (TIGR02646 family)